MDILYREHFQNETKLYVVMFEDGQSEAISEIFLSPILAEMYRKEYQLRSSKFRYRIVQMYLYDNFFLKALLTKFEER